ncbi:MAG TPA: hypothetical protein DIC42_05195 [Holosporales bacterium]|nr:hypothetical protein [Holosporales bacterium]
MTNTKFKTGKLLLSMASAAVIFIGGLNEGYGATLNTEATTLKEGFTSSTATSTVTVVGGITKVAPAVVAATATTTELHVLHLREEGVEYTAGLALGSHALCTKPIIHNFAYVGPDQTVAVAMTIAQICPGDVLKIFMAADDTAAPTTLTATALTWGAFSAADKLVYDGRVANIIYYGPNLPTYTPTAGVNFTFKQTSKAAVMAMINKV